ncbi:MAG: malto-oligosyltrehalose synthase [Thermoleophilia bacterium]|nr:malto-oligosyltrehalose synthase [Thermoleophilia bacterium]
MADARRRTPVSTYRLQLRREFTFADAAAAVPRIAALGVTHLYLSPVLQAVPGSAHGYDVIDHTRISDDLGGEDGLRALARAAHAEGLGIVVDVVPNHVALPVPETANPRLWSLLRDGPRSASARWFDVDRSGQEGAVLLAVLGNRIGRCLADGEITLDASGEEPVVRYLDHVFPVRPGTEDLPLPELLDAQWYRLAHWRVADEELNYRRFFDVDTLAGVRVDDPEVFDAMHATLLRLHRDGVVDGFRIDHPDGLADPRGYLERLRDATGGAWVVVEKILEGDEALPGDWPCAGTTGYEAIARLHELLTDPSGAAPLGATWAAADDTDATFVEAAVRGRRDVLAGPLRAEVNRLVELAAEICRTDIMLRDHTRRGLEEALVEMLAAFPVYRAYVRPGEEPAAEAVAAVEEAAEAAAGAVPDRADEVVLLSGLALGRAGRDARRDAFCVRFQQTTGPAMAKGVEDTALYRWFPLAALNEVGGDPGVMGAPPDRLHAWARDRAARHPLAMTALTTHDTKRSEDVRARLLLLAECPPEWAALLDDLRALSDPHRRPAPPVHPADELLMWQTALGAWPIDAGRLSAYMVKALREAKRRSRWTAPDAAYEAAVTGLAQAALADPAVGDRLGAFAAELHDGWRSNALTQKLLQLTLPGVADTYQGGEALLLTLVDPDNRGPVDHAGLAGRLRALDAGGVPLDLDDEKLLVTSRALRLRRDHPEWFTGPRAGHAPLATTSAHAVGYVRAGTVAAVGTRLPLALAREGGWGSAAIALPDGEWRDVLTGGAPVSGMVPAASLLADLPVALLVRDGA